MAFTPGKFKQQRTLEAPFEDVPPHLWGPLWKWIDSGFLQGGNYSESRISAVAVYLRITLDEPRDYLRVESLQAACRDPEFMLTLVEAMLDLFRSDLDRHRARLLDKLLSDANSAYGLSETQNGLELRVASGVRELVQESANAATGSAGDHLTAAWNEAYGLNPDPVKSYSESIKAVEAALAPHVSPQNNLQTLGTMIRDVAAKPGKWEFEIPDGTSDNVGTVLNLMRLLWDGQTSRHAGVAPTRPETIEEARAAVHVAATLVQFGVGGAFRLK